MLEPDGAHLQQLGHRLAYGRGVEPVGERRDDRLLGARRLAHNAQDGRGRLVEREHGRARHEVQEIVSRRVKQMKLAWRQGDHRLTSA